MKRPADPLISIVVPCFNEQEALPILIERIEAAARAWPTRYEVICVDDGSRDRTWALLQAQAARSPQWRSFSFSRNFGHQAAVSAGLQKARGDAAIVIDADLQDPPEELIRFIEAWREGSDVVYSVRESREDPALKKLLAWAYYRLLEKITSIRIPRDSGDFALLDRKVLDAINGLPERSRYLRGLRAWVGFKQRALVFKRAARAAGQPHYTFRASLQLALDGIFSFSTAPLRLASYLGFFMATAAVFLLVVGFLRQLFPDALAVVPPFSRLSIGLLLIGGVQLISLGIVGEYLARIYDEVKARPAWIIEETTERSG